MNQRLAQDVISPPIPAIKAKFRKMTPKTKRTFDLTQALPSTPTYPKIRQALSEAVLREDVSFYTEVEGIPELREEIAQRHTLAKTLRPNEVLVTAGANHAMYTALTTLFSPGDKVALLEPFYFNYDMALKMMDLEPFYVPLSAGKGFGFEADSVINALEGSGAKGIVLITPNNPTGARYEPREIEKFPIWAQKSGVATIIDETYGSFDRSHLRGVDLAPYLGHGLSFVGSFSKTHSLTGYRVGYWITDATTMDQALKVQDTMVICASHVGQLAALAGLRHCDADLQEKIETYASLGKTLVESVGSLKKFRLRSHGAFFAYFEHPFPKLSAEEACFWLYENAGLMTLPGTVFGPSQERFLRMAFCNVDRESLQQAITQLAEAERHI